MELFNTIASKLAAFPLGWSLFLAALGYIVVILKRCDVLQQARLDDYKLVLSRYEELVAKLGAK